MALIPLMRHETAGAKAPELLIELFSLLRIICHQKTKLTATINLLGQFTGEILAFGW